MVLESALAEFYITLFLKYHKLFPFKPLPRSLEMTEIITVKQF